MHRFLPSNCQLSQHQLWYSPDPPNWAPSLQLSSFSRLPHLGHYTSHFLPTKPSGHPPPCSGSTGPSSCSFYLLPALLPHFFCIYTLLLVTSLLVQTLIIAWSGSSVNCPEVTSNSEDIKRTHKKISRKKKILHVYPLIITTAHNVKIKYKKKTKIKIRFALGCSFPWF